MAGGTAGSDVLGRWLVARATSGRSYPTALSLSDDAVDWPGTILKASEDFAVTALATMLEGAGLFDRAPADVQQFLRYALEQNAEANRRIRAQCAEIGAALQPLDLCGVLLKGAAWLFDEGPAAKDRMLRDIDLLIPRRALDRVRAVLTGLGYAPVLAVVAEPGHIHDRPLEHPDRMVRVELHVELTTRVACLGTGEVLEQARSVAPGLMVPAPLHRMVHNVVHAQIVNGDFVAGALNFRDSLDLGRLVRSHAAGENWPAIADDARRRGFFRSLSGGLHKAAYVSGVELPEPFRSDAAGRRHLRRCLRQRRWPRADRAMRKLGQLHRAMAWERDAYPLQLGADRSLRAHFLVNRRRLERIRAALTRSLESA